MRYWRGYLAAAIFAAISLGLTQIAKRFSLLVDMVYPYVTRFLQNTLADWTASADFVLWQLLAVLILVAIVTTLVLAIILKWNLIRWLGWVTAAASLLWMLHTGIYGLNYYAGPLAEDIRLTVEEFTAADLEDATIFFRDQANKLAQELPRDEQGDLVYSDFETLAQQAGSGFETLTYDGSKSVFAGNLTPVKKLGWADFYTSMGITGVTMPLTGEAAVNPQIPAVSLPFTMCHEMAHRMCIALEDDANLAAFLACAANESPEFRYSAYYMGYRYLYSAMANSGDPAVQVAAARIHSEVNSDLLHDLQSYDRFFRENRNDFLNRVGNTVNDTYIKVSGDEAGTASYGQVATLLVNWYIQEQVLPFETPDEDNSFDPLDKDQVDITDILPGRG